MAAHFHTLTVKKIQRETPDCIAITFDIPEVLKKEFEFNHGQNITVKANIGNEEVRRSYSICSAPYENELTIAVKKVEDGRFSSFANSLLREGMMLEVLSPTGKFQTALNKEYKKNYVAFAAGSGITPVISIIKTTLATEPQSNFTLVYNNRNRNSIIFFETLEALKNKYMHRFQLIHILSRERTENDISFGRLTQGKMEALSKLINYKTVDEFFICGPSEMIFIIKDFLLANSIDEKKIHFELFAAVKRNLNNEHISKNLTTAAKSIITIKIDGRNFEFEKPFDNKSILDAAIEAGADLPFACKGGVCCTCKAKLMEGKVEMDIHWGLEDEEVEKGYILTCQSHPVTDKVFIDFDGR